MAENLKDKIAETFLEMTARKSFDKITIKDLVQECGISRQAFYYHFQDILDVIEWILQEGAKRLLDRCLQAENTRAALRLFKDFALENLYQHTAVDASMSYWDLSIALDFFTYGIGGVLIESSRNGRTDPEVLTDQLYRLLSGQMVQMPL